jgi:hypothetical protein
MGCMFRYEMYVLSPKVRQGLMNSRGNISERAVYEMESTSDILGLQSTLSTPL